MVVTNPNGRQARNSGGKKNLLFVARKRANLSQQTLADLLGITRDAVGRYESGKLSLEGEGGLIVAWLYRCKADLHNSRVIAFLYDTGNAPALKDPNCEQCRQQYVQAVLALHTHHRRHAPSRRHPVLRGRDLAAVEREHAQLYASVTRTHPYTPYVPERLEDDK